ncbi:MAG: ABC transporter permease [Bacteroidaceae bacterium]|nr:ABC transporter permease [Bacteroidaceae bacterium]
MIRRIYLIFKKEWLHIIRDIRTFILVMLMPLLLCNLLSLVFSTDIKDISVAVCMPESSPRAMEIVGKLQNNPAFRFRGFVASAAEGEKLMKSDRLDAILIFHPDFDRIYEKIDNGDSDFTPPIEILVDASNCVTGNAAAMYIRSAVGHPQSASDIISEKMLYNPGLLSAYTFQPGIMAYVCVFLCAVLSAVSLVREMESGTVDALRTAPVTRYETIVGKLLPYLIIGIVSTALAMLSGMLLHGIPMRGSISAIILLTMLYIITSLLLGLMISLFCTNQTNAYVISLAVVSLPVLYFGGIIVPVENLPDWGRHISDLLYVRWYTDAIRKLMIQGVGWSQVLRETLNISYTTMLLLVSCIFKLKTNR